MTQAVAKTVIAGLLVGLASCTETVKKDKPKAEPDLLYQYFTPGILTGVITSLFLLIVLIFGICLISQIESTVPVIPKQKKN